MTPIAGQPILTAAEMRAAEDTAIAEGATVESLMERAGREIAIAVQRLAGGRPILILCGPGNNGGDGYVAARFLRDGGTDVRVAALGEPKTAAAIAARSAWNGPVEAFMEADDAPVVVDALFGTGMTRDLDWAVQDRLNDFIAGSTLAIAVDLPSGQVSDSGAASLQQDAVDITLALGALKPAHVLYPAAEYCGDVRVLDIGLDLMVRQMPDASSSWTMHRPRVPTPYRFAHKYSRGMVVVIGGAMPGAAALAAQAAMHSGAGYVLLLGDYDASETPHALVRRHWSREALGEAIKGKMKDKTVIVVGPGLGREKDAPEKLLAAIETGLPLVIDGDALRLLDDASFAAFKARPPYVPVVLTPHEGEFKAVFGEWSGSKIDAAQAASQRSGAIVVFKGPDTVVAYPDGRTRVGPPASVWLSTAGTGDVLAGTVGALLATTTFEPVEAAVWMHGDAARRLGGAFIADDLARELSAVRARL